MKTKRCIGSELLLAFVVCISISALVGGCFSRVPENSITKNREVSFVTEESQIVSPTPIEIDEIVFEEVDEKQYLYAVVGEENVVVLGNGTSHEIKGVLSFFQYHDELQYSIDGSRVAMLMTENDDGFGRDISYDEGTGRLITYDGYTEYEIATDVDRFQISLDGSAIAYLTGNYSEGIGGNLYLYDCEKGETELISEGAGRLYALSPTGNSISYTTFEQSGDPESLVCHIKTGANPSQEVVKGMYPVALTDDGSLVYTVRRVDGVFQEQAEVELWVYKGIEGTLLCPAIKSEYLQDAEEYLFNSSCTQVLFSYYDGVYFSRDGSDAALLVKEAVLPKINYGYSNGYYRVNHYDTGLNGSRSAFLNTQNLYNVMLTIHLNSTDGNGINNIWYFNEKNETQILNEVFVSQRWIQSGGSILAITGQDWNLMYIEDIYSNSEPVKVGANASFPIILTSSNTALYISGDPEAPGLYSVRISDDMKETCLVSSCIGVVLHSKENEPDRIYYLEGNDPADYEDDSYYVDSYYFDLYMVEDTEGASPVKIAEKVASVGTGEFGVYYLSLGKINDDLYDQNNLFYSSDGETFENVATIDVRYLYGG